MAIFLEIVTSPNCPHSPKAVKLAQEILKKTKGIGFREVNMITEWGMQRAQAFGVTATPTIILNGRVIFVGIPEKKALERVLKDEIRKEREKQSYFF
ncbi:MAG: thioredoxin family protein [Candidatus Anstonellales archaeon]